MSDQTKILVLPDRAVREWGAVRNTLAVFLENNGIDEETIEHAMSAVRPVFMKCASAEKQSISTSWLLLDVAVLAVDNFALRRELDLIRGKS